MVRLVLLMLSKLFVYAKTRNKFLERVLSFLDPYPVHNRISVCTLKTLVYSAEFPDPVPLSSFVLASVFSQLVFMFVTIIDLNCFCFLNVVVVSFSCNDCRNPFLFLTNITIC